MVRLLILCRYFPPENKIGAIRPSKIAKYLNRTDKYKITVLAAVPYGVECPEYEITHDGIEIFRVGTSRLDLLLHYKKSGKGAAVASEIGNSPKKKSFKHFIITKFFRFRLVLEKHTMLSNAKKVLRDRTKEFDVIFSTYNTEFGHLIADWYKKRHKNVKWIADFRDSVWLAGATPKQIKKAQKFAQKAAKGCDIITAVTNGIIETHKQDFKDRESVVVYNGFDCDDIPEAEALKDGILRMVYTGELYSGQRDLTPIFKALSTLSKEGRIDLSKVQVIYAGNSGGVFEHQIKPFEEINYLNKGFVPRPDALKLQLEGNILLLSSWCHKGDKHTLTGKFFEYLGMSKPIVSVVAGDEKGSLLSEMININDLGFCYEEASDNSDFEQLCNYLEKQYNSLETEGLAEFSPNKEFVKRFEYSSIAEEINKIIYNLLNKK